MISPKRKYKLSDFMSNYEQRKQFYSDNFDKKNIYDSFFKKNTGIYTLSSYIRKYFGSKIFPKYGYICSKCDYVTLTDYFNLKPTCGSHSCRNLRRPQSIQKNNRLKKLWDERDKFFDYQCKETGVIFHLKNHIEVKKFISHLKNNGIDYKNYMIKHHKDKISYCLECDILIEIKNISPFSNKKKEFCCIKHYHDFLKKFPNHNRKNLEDIYKKQSITLKKKIKNGEFTPARNHYTSWGAVNSLTNKKYRSRWELIYHMAYPNLLYEHTRIEYYDNEKSKNRIYIVDFTDPITGNLYEIKPSTEMTSENVISKRNKAIEYANKNNVEYIILNENDIIESYEKIKHKIIEKDVKECVEKLKKQKLKTSKK